MAFPTVKIKKPQRKNEDEGWPSKRERVREREKRIQSLGISDAYTRVVAVGSALACLSLPETRVNARNRLFVPTDLLFENVGAAPSKRDRIEIEAHPAWRTVGGASLSYSFVNSKT